jgi:mitochondrial pyruvate carrier 2
MAGSQKVKIISQNRHSAFGLKLLEPMCGYNTITKTFTNTPQALVMASLDDYRRPLDKVSTSQSASLAATGFIWTRYCLVIKPINYSLSLCNFSLGIANAIQCYRAYSYQKSTKNIAAGSD